MSSRSDDQDPGKQRRHLAIDDKNQSIAFSDRKQPSTCADEEEKYRLIVENAGEAIFVIQEGIFKFANAKTYELLGCKEEEVLSLPFVDFIHPDDRSFVVERHDRRIQGKEPPSLYSFRILNPAHQTRWVELKVVLIQWEGKNATLNFLSDITDRKTAEDTKNALEAQLFNALEIAHLGHWEYDVESDYFTFNDPFYKIFRSRVEDVGGYRISSAEYARRFVHPDDGRLVEEEIRACIETDDPHFTRQLEHKMIYSDGETGYIIVRFFIVKDIQGRTVKICGVNQDVTERKRVEDALEKRMISLTRPLDDPAGIGFEDLFNPDEIQDLQDKFSKATGVASVITNPDGIPLTRPSNFCRLCADIIRKTEKGLINCYKSDAVIGRRSDKGPTIQPCLSGGLWDAGAAITVGGKHIANWLIGQVRDETQTDEKIRRYAREIGADENDAVAAFYEVPAMSREQFGVISQTLFTLANQLSSAAYQNVQQARFINEIKATKEESRLNQERMQAILEASPDPVVVYDIAGHVTFLNPAFSRLFGWSPEELLGRRIPFVPEEEREMTSTTIEKLMQKGGTSSLETKRMTKDGRMLDILVSAAVVSDEHGRKSGMVVNLTDLSTIRKMETQLRQAQKMESIGRLAGGVAHDFNNMLSVIIGHAELAMEKTDTHPQLSKALLEIRKAAQRSADITHQLLAFARRQTIAPKILDLNATVQNMLTMLRRLIGENIELVWLPGEDLWPIKMDPSQIDQILANLCVNARDAITGVGKLILKTGTARFDGAFCADHMGYVPGDFILLDVSDDGSGMDHETLKNLFEPFFTTKGNKGTGLGLATVYGIVKQNNGFINVYSELGKGTTFKIFLPRHIGSEDPVNETGLEKGLKSGSETILLVEDEPSILEVAKQLLQKLGYTVLVSNSPRKALRTAQKHAGEIDLLITDVVMPEMNGRDLSEKLISLYPRMKCLYMSGYTADIIAHHGILEEGMHFIQKPFSMQEVADKVREVLSCSN